MGPRKRYRKKADQVVLAVQLRLESEGFSYRKWGGEQRCKPGDWLVDNGGDVYTVDQDVFATTYRQIDPGRHLKITPVWAEKASEPGIIKTKEGRSQYKAGDYLVYNNQDGSDGYCVSAEKFESMYALDE